MSLALGKTLTRLLAATLLNIVVIFISGPAYADANLIKSLQSLIFYLNDFNLAVALNLLHSLVKLAGTFTHDSRLAFIESPTAVAIQRFKEEFELLLQLDTRSLLSIF